MTIDSADEELEERLRVALDEMIPKMMGRSRQDGVEHDESADSVLVHPVPLSRPLRRVRAAALLLGAAAVVGLLVIATRGRGEVVPISNTSVAPSPSTPIEATTTTPAPTMSPVTTAGEVTPPRLLPTAMPAGFDDIADDYLTDTEGAGASSTTTRLFAGPGEQPTIVMLVSEASVQPGNSAGTDGLRNMTEQASWPAFRLDVVRPSGRHDFIASGGLTAEQVQAISDSLADVDVLSDTSVSLPFDLTEIAFHHTPSNAHGITWNGNTDQQITMYVEQSWGIDAFGVGISYPITAYETPAGRVFAVTDPTDDGYVQAGLVVDGQVINFEARNVPIDEVVAMAASVATVSDVTWASRVPD
ncbi:MAG TPA: hypothetical protein PK020_08455 [Ilumatobacteraceae bacterium]|nr:hypothetical protein [Ilumatobacteraceae bacterium]